MSPRTALVTSSYAPRTGGVETHVQHVARVLAARGETVEVWAVDQGEHLGTRVLDGVTVRYLPTPQPSRGARGALSFAVRWPAAAWRWIVAYRSLRPDVLHVQCFGPNGVYATALGRVTRTPLVVSSHGETFADDHDALGTSWWMRTWFRAALARADAVTGCSTIVTEDLAERFGYEDAVVVPNGVELGAPTTDPARPPAPRTGPADPPDAVGPPALLAVGRVEHVKGFDLLLEAFASSPLAERARLTIVGDGSELAELRRRARALGVEDRVSFPGMLGPDAVAEALAAATVVVVPSRKEAASIVVLEAWRAGRPVVGTVLGGPRTLLTDGVDGLLVDPRDAAALARAISSLLDDPDRAAAMGAAGRREVEHYTWEAVVDRYDAVYDRVLASRSVAARHRGAPAPR
ncbi:glycosyltransferase family 1 protein [Oerskovia turbata]|uniref:D-inositol 3-phosphate glycosyltransferase n=1 Tax=Oerskovia turbata TaxID=1713 RepID=A0A4Q1KWB8_9CELL|nr:glycosyltransferase family 4 protein [Oerskovia turbata]RXR26830.1 glycosyltransferase family 1 protein [Oerskovia turbata]RXR34563.1 glycosyltransferase family 1 protein [Oerskovia turbata]